MGNNSKVKQLVELIKQQHDCSKELLKLCGDIEQDSLLSKKVFRIKGKSFYKGEELRVFWRPAFMEKVYQGTLIDVLDIGEIPTTERLLDCYRFDLAKLKHRQTCFYLLGKPVKEPKVVLERSNGHRVVIPFCGIERVEKFVHVVDTEYTG